jgi:hypothetical protein
MCACGRNAPQQVATTLQVEQERIAREMAEIRDEVAEVRQLESAQAAVSNANS